MTRPMLWLIGSIVGPWIAIAGLVLLALGTGVVEILCLELAALTVAVIAVAALLTDGPAR